MDGFHFCSGVENIILDLEKIEASPKYVDLIKYLDSVVKVFDGPCASNNIIGNALFKIYEMGYVDEKTHKFFSYFWDMHKRCGLILVAQLKEK